MAGEQPLEKLRSPIVERPVRRTTGDGDEAEQSRDADGRRRRTTAREIRQRRSTV